MKVSISKSHIKGSITAPPSKSYTIRGLMCAALTEGESEVSRPLISEDTEAALNVLGGVGVGIKREEGLWRLSGGNFHEPKGDLFCGDSAATLRFMTALCSQVPVECRLVPGPTLARRPVKTLIEALRQLGADCSAQGDFAPVTVRHGLSGGVTELPGNISSQYISALLLAAPLAGRGVTIRLNTPLESKPYILMTLDCLKRFGIRVETSPDYREFRVSPQVYKPARYTVEGDWSSVSYFLALGAISGPVTVTNINPDSLQGDKIMLSFLKEMGAGVDIDKDAVTVRKSKLNGIRADLTDCIDLLPTMAVLGAVADGATELNGIERARIKESNRILAVRENLERMGVKVHEESNRLIITGTIPKGTLIDSKNDHRIAMAFSVLGTVAGDTVIDEAECVAKTFPEYWKVLQGIGGEVKTDE